MNNDNMTNNMTTATNEEELTMKKIVTTFFALDENELATLAGTTTHTPAGSMEHEKVENEKVSSKNTSPCMLSKKGKFQCLEKQTEAYRAALARAQTPEEVENALSEMDKMLNTIKNDSDLAAEMDGWRADLQGTIQGVRLHDITRNKLLEMLVSMIDRVKEIIVAEEKKSRVAKLKKLLNQLAEHAEEIAEIIDIDELLS